MREIGWAKWDPIGIRAAAAAPGGPVDEYDSYLVHAAGLAYQGRSCEEVADYLHRIARDHMAIGEHASRAAAEETAAAICGYVASLAGRG